MNSGSSVGEGGGADVLDTDEGVAAVAAGHSARGEVDRHGPRCTVIEYPVAARAADQRVVAAVPAQRVVARSADEHVREG